MNAARRNRIEQAISLIAEAQEILEECSSEEQEYLDNMPENLQNSERASMAQDASENLYAALDFLRDAESAAEVALG